MTVAYDKSWFSGRGWGQQLFSFQSPAVHWMARPSSLNWLSCRDPSQTPHSLNATPLCTENPFFHWKVLRRIPFPKTGSYTSPHFLSSMPTKRAEYCFESTVSGGENSMSSAANSVSSASNSVSSIWHTNNRLRGTHWVPSPELSEAKQSHWARCFWRRAEGVSIEEVRVPKPS